MRGKKKKKQNSERKSGSCLHWQPFCIWIITKLPSPAQIRWPFVLSINWRKLKSWITYMMVHVKNVVFVQKC
jgi:hypothetical protein